MKTFILTISIPAITITALLGFIALTASGEGIVIHPDAPHTVAICTTATTWDLTTDAAYPAEVSLVNALAAEVCPQVAGAHQ